MLISLFESEPQRSECCKTHPGKLIEVFCDLHVELGCSACLLTRHKGCELIPLEDFIKRGKFKRCCSKDNDLLLQYRKLYENTINEVNNNIDEIKKSKIEIMEEVKKTRTKTEKIMKALEEKLIEMLNSDCQREIDTLNEQANKYRSVIRDINCTMEQVKTAQTDIPQVCHSEASSETDKEEVW